MGSCSWPGPGPQVRKSLFGHSHTRTTSEPILSITSCRKGRLRVESFVPRFVSQSHHWKPCLLKEDGYFKLHLLLAVMGTQGIKLSSQISESFQCTRFINWFQVSSSSGCLSRDSLPPSSLPQPNSSCYHPRLLCPKLNWKIYFIYPSKEIHANPLKPYCYFSFCAYKFYYDYHLLCSLRCIIIFIYYFFLNDESLLMLI